MKCAPLFEDEPLIDITPVNYLADAIVTILSSRENDGGLFHITTPLPLAHNILWDHVSSYGFKFERMPYVDWREMALEMSKSDPHNVLRPLRQHIAESEESFFPVHFDCSRTTAALKGSGIVGPAPSKELVHTLLNFLERVGFLSTSHTKENSEGSSFSTLL